MAIAFPIQVFGIEGVIVFDPQIDERQEVLPNALVKHATVFVFHSHPIGAHLVYPAILGPVYVFVCCEIFDCQSPHLCLW